MKPQEQPEQEELRVKADLIQGKNTKKISVQTSKNQIKMKIRHKLERPRPRSPFQVLVLVNKKT